MFIICFGNYICNMRNFKIKHFNTAIMSIKYLVHVKHIFHKHAILTFRAVFHFKSSIFTASRLSKGAVEGLRRLIFKMTGRLLRDVQWSLDKGVRRRPAGCSSSALSGSACTQAIVLISSASPNVPTTCPSTTGGSNKRLPCTLKSSAEIGGSILSGQRPYRCFTAYNQ